MDSRFRGNDEWCGGAVLRRRRQDQTRMRWKGPRFADPRPETFADRDVGEEPTGMYSRRVSGRGSAERGPVATANECHGNATVVSPNEARDAQIAVSAST